MPRGADTMRLAHAAMDAFARGDRTAAQNLAGELLRANPRDPNGHQVLGLIALDLGDISAAKLHLKRADAAAPNQPRILNSLGIALRRSGDLGAARKAYARAGELGLVDGWRNLGNLEGLANDHVASTAAYEKALSLREDDAVSHAGLAQGLEQRHDLARARQHAVRALALDPRNEIARLALAQVMLREEEFDEAERTAESLAHESISQTNRALAWGVVGEARDRRGLHATAFEAFAAANNLLLEQHGHLKSATDLTYHPDGVQRMLAAVDAADFSTWRAPASFQSPAPVFLIGFPRSGTTLLDQILSVHSRIVTMEERELLAASVRDLAIKGFDVSALAELPPAEIQRRRRDYWKWVRTEMKEAMSGRLLLDKLPLNIIYLPYIARFFPDAKIIVAIRDPRDVVLSCYQQRFGMNPAMVQFLELESAAAYYDVVMRLFQVCWDRTGLRMHVVRYEDVVSDIDAIVRKACEFLGLQFEPAMLEFNAAAKARAIGTPSARQVVQPIYTRSIGRWKAYRDQLAPVLPQLEGWARQFGYED